MPFMQVWHFQKPISTTLRLKRGENIWRNILNISKHCTHCPGFKKDVSGKIQWKVAIHRFLTKAFFLYLALSIFGFKHCKNCKSCNPKGGRYGDPRGWWGCLGSPKGSKGYIAAPGGQGELLGGPQGSRGHIGDCKVSKGASLGSQRG